jgi:hypothetical protein
VAARIVSMENAKAMLETYREKGQNVVKNADLGELL